LHKFRTVWKLLFNGGGLGEWSTATLYLYSCLSGARGQGTHKSLLWKFIRERSLNEIFGGERNLTARIFVSSFDNECGIDNQYSRERELVWNGLRWHEARCFIHTSILWELSHSNTASKSTLHAEATFTWMPFREVTTRRKTLLSFIRMWTVRREGGESSFELGQGPKSIEVDRDEHSDELLKLKGATLAYKALGCHLKAANNMFISALLWTYGMSLSLLVDDLYLLVRNLRLKFVRSISVTARRWQRSIIWSSDNRWGIDNHWNLLNFILSRLSLLWGRRLWSCIWLGLLQ